MSRPPVALTPQGVRVDLGEEIARGGEGAVYAVRGENDVVAKIYHHAADPAKAAKLAAMVSMGNPDLAGISAWPRELLHVGGGRELRGVVMPRVHEHRPLHVLYSPAQRRREFPRADWRFLVHAARNLAAAFATFHQYGHVVGDVNQGNVLVSRDGTVKLIDCDSMQIREGGRVHLCEVGVAHFTPPELQGRSFAGIVRDANHDAFGLAVLLFHLLFMGRHPFAGIYGGRGEMPLEKAIAEGRFAYGRNAVHALMRPPPHTVALAHLAPPVADLFERAFAAGATPRRPEAREWVAALQQMGGALQPCERNPAHRLVPSPAGCPWCAIERAGGPDFFVSLTVASIAGSGLDLETLWRDIQALPLPAEPGKQLLNPPPAATAVPISPGLRTAYHAGGCSLMAGAVALAFAVVSGGFGIALAGGGLLVLWVLLSFASGAHDERKQRREHLRSSTERHRQVVDRYAREVNTPLKELTRLRQEMDRRRGAYHDLPAQYRAARGALEQQVRQNQLRRFLDRHYLSSARIAGVGSVKVDALASYGIETAADVTYQAVIQVNGFGPKLTQKVVDWRTKLESRFVFDARAGVDPADVAELDRKFGQKRKEMEKELTELALRIRRTAEAAGHAHAVVFPLLQSAAASLSQAKADVRVI